MVIDKEKEKKKDNDFKISKNKSLSKSILKPKNTINKSLIKTIAVLKSKDLSSRKGNIKSFITSLYYNLNNSKKFDVNSPSFPLFLFDKKITAENKYELSTLLNSFLYMSYRTGFINLKAVNCPSHTSDCGWGCMLRCSQMILSKGFINKKIFNLSQSSINANLLKKLKIETLALFNDNYLSLEEVLSHPDYEYFFMLFENVVKEDSEYNYNSISKIIPPYSIHILCKLGNCSGIFTSDMNMINTIIKINNDLFDDINIIDFCVGSIKTKQLFREFCQPFNGSNNYDNSELIHYNGVDYVLKKGGIIFISLRLGYDMLEPEYYKVIPLLFSKFRNNIGIIGGIKKRAYYFIGINGENKLIFVDPHYPQETKDNCDEYYETYNTKNFYLLDIKDMRSQFSLGIGIFGSRQFNEFLEDAK